MPVVTKQSSLLAVDLGLRSGIAAYDCEGRLTAFGVQAYRSREAMRRGAGKTVAEHGQLEWLVSYGCPTQAAVWERSAMRQGVRVQRVDGETWRQALAVNDAPRNSAENNRHVVRLARRIIDWAQMPQPVVLPTDAAEAICVGLWAVHQLGWLRELPVARRTLQRAVARPRTPMARVANG